MGNQRITGSLTEVVRTREDIMIIQTIFHTYRDDFPLLSDNRPPSFFDLNNCDDLITDLILNLSDLIWTYLILSDFILSDPVLIYNLIISYPMLSYRYLILSYLLLSDLIFSYLILSYLVCSCLNWPYLIIPHLRRSPLRPPSHPASELVPPTSFEHFFRN